MCPVRIIQKDERLIYNVGDTKFYYKRISSERASAIRRKHTKRGELDAGAAGFEMLRTYILDWDNVQDWDGNQVEFTSENIALIPDEILAELISMISSSDGILADTVEDAVKTPEKAVKNS